MGFREGTILNSVEGGEEKTSGNARTRHRFYRCSKESYAFACLLIHRGPDILLMHLLVCLGVQICSLPFEQVSGSNLR